MTWNRDKVRSGMRVVTANGRELGRVIRTGDDTFVVERGGDDPRAYELRHRYVTDVRGDDVVYQLEDRAGGGIGDKLSAAATAARERLGGHGAGRGALAETGRDRVETARERVDTARDRLESHEEDLRMALMDEEMAIEKVARELGHVRIRKEVRIEEKHITVPVRVEEVIIERVPVGRAAAADADLSFRGQELDLALHDEEVRVTKRPMVREELRIRKVVRSEDRDASASLRHEDVAVDDTAHPGPFPFRRGTDGRTDRH
jgi:uncharacterized protein (TIGR02271 family)